MTIYHSCFPNLASTGYEKASNPDNAENCIAFAAGALGQWWEPIEGRFWPTEVPYDYKIESLVCLFRLLGYEVCDSADLEDGYEKVALYGREEEYEHVARQLEDGTWVSKLGREDDIVHPTLDSLAGGDFGSVLRIMKRSRIGP